MYRPRRRVFTMLIASVFAAATLAAQSNTGDVHGRAIDELGQPIANGTATLSGAAAPHVTDLEAQGLFRFFRVPPGTYTLSIAAAGFATVTRAGVVVSAGRNTQVEIPLPLSRVEQDVLVTGETPLVDPRKVA